MRNGPGTGQERIAGKQRKLALGIETLRIYGLIRTEI